MPSLFQTTFETRVRPAEERAFGVEVVFRQNGRNTAAFTATWESPGDEVAGETLKTDVVKRDWILPAEALVIAGETVNPLAGGIIRETETGHRFEIASESGEPAAKLLAGNYRWLVHTNRITDG